MKTILTTLLLALSVVTFAKTSNPTEVKQVIDTLSKGVGTVYSDLKSTAPQVYSALSKVTSHLSSTVGHAWDITIKQQRVNSIYYLLYTLSAILAWFVFGKYIVLKSNAENERLKHLELVKSRVYSKFKLDDTVEVRFVPNVNKNEELDPHAVSSWYDTVLVLTLILALVSTVVSAWNFKSMLTGFLNPEYGAMELIVKLATEVSK